MAAIRQDQVVAALEALPSVYKGPGGVAGVVHEGRVIAARAWGYADMARRVPMGQGTRLPICSISKQFTCAALLDQVPDMARLDGRVRDFLPNLTDPLPTVKQLCDMQSGLRDYWALTVLHGAAPEQTFPREAALPVLARMKTGHFAPGTSYSYSNCNFRILSELVEGETGRDLATLYRERIFDPAGMATAVLAPDTRQPVDGVVGYEGNDFVGYLPADNGIYWIGDAGISASLSDMLAWERFIDATRDDPQGLYNRLAAPPRFADGAEAAYGFGLKHDVVAGHRTTGHGGALRGFRAHRIHAAAARLSVVVIFNHEADAHGAAYGLMETALGATAPAGLRPEGWDGLWLDEARGLALRLTSDDGGVTLHYGTTATRLKVTAQDRAEGGGVVVERGPSGLVMHRPGENFSLTPTPRPACMVAPAQDLAGRWWSDEVEAELHFDWRDGAVYAGFDGHLGRGPMERCYALGRDLWVIRTRRSMDSSPPGDWTVQVRRDAAGQATGLVVGCWLARNILYRRV